MNDSVNYLKLRWAKFFTLAGLDWEPALRPGYDFHVILPCGHSECPADHQLLVIVLEGRHDELVRRYDTVFTHDEIWDVPSPAFFADGPGNTHWNMAHGHGGGYYTMAGWWLNRDADELWKRTLGWREDKKPVVWNRPLLGRRS